MAKIKQTYGKERATTSRAWRGSRSPKESFGLHFFYYGFRLNEFQNIGFERLYKNSGVITES